MPARVLLLSASLLFLVDQSVKAWALARLGDDCAVALGAVRLRAVVHRPAGNRRARGEWTLAALWLAEAAALVALVQLAPFFQGTVAPGALGAALGGAGS